MKKTTTNNNLDVPIRQQRFLQMLREGLPPPRRRKRLRKTPPFPSQLPLERNYRNEILGLIQPAFDLVREAVLPEIDDLLLSAESERLQLDASGDDIARIFAGVRVRFLDVFTDNRIESSIGLVANRTNQQNQATVRRQFQTVLGIDPTQAEPWLEPLLESHATENVSLIKTLPNEAFPDLEQIVLRGTRAGDSAASISKQLRERWDITEGRARVIARDQVSKLSAGLNRNRQRQAGVQEFIWKDVDDSKVRKTHAQRDRETFRWDKSMESQLRAKGLKVDTIDGFPGEPINCRCVPLPVFTSMV